MMNLLIGSCATQASASVGPVAYSSSHHNWLIFPAAWLWFVEHKEVAINISDLVSFFLITPELLKGLVSRAIIRAVTFYLPLVLVAIVAITILYVTSDMPFFRWVAYLVIIPSAIVAAFFAAISIWVIRMVAGAGSPAEDTDTIFAKKALFLIGVLLFVLSRFFVVLAAFVEGAK